MTQACQLCHDNVASVFRPTIALCKPCYRDVQRMEIEDGEVPNVEFCSCHDRPLAECTELRRWEAHRRMSQVA